MQQYLDCCGPVIVVKTTHCCGDKYCSRVYCCRHYCLPWRGKRRQRRRGPARPERRAWWCRASWCVAGEWRREQIVGGRRGAYIPGAPLAPAARLPPPARPPTISPSADNACKLTPPRYLRLPVYSRNWHWINNHRDKP